MQQATQAWTRVGTNIKTKMLSIPTKAAPLVIGCKTIPQVKEVLDQHVYEALNELSEMPSVHN